MKDEKTFIEIFENLEDPRDNRGKIYPLIDILLLALYGVLAGFSDFTNMSYYLKKREAELSEEFGLSKGVPSHDVFSDVFRVIDIEKFMALFVEWTKNLALAKTGQHIAIDGKAVRAAAKKAENGNIPYVLSAFMCGCGISIGQKEVGEKTNEIPEIPKLLDLIDITDCTVTIDAIGTQKDIMDKIIDKGGHFCLQLKKNQRAAFEDVDLFFRDLEEKNKDFQKLSSYTETAKDHGRIEGREYYTFADTDAGCQVGTCEMHWHGTPYKDNRRSSDKGSALSSAGCGNSGGKIYGTGKGTLGNRKQPALGSGYPFSGRRIDGKQRKCNIKSGIAEENSFQFYKTGSCHEKENHKTENDRLYDGHSVF